MVLLSDMSKANLDAMILQAVGGGRVPGVTLVVGTADKVLYHGALGSKVYGDPSSGPIDENTVYWICSQTKLVVSIAILQLIEQGLINYETPVEDIMPEMANPIVLDDPTARKSTHKPAQKKIVIKNLLNHTSGLFYGIDREQPGALPIGYTSEGYAGDHSVEGFFKVLKQDYPSVPLAFEPGTKWEYGWNLDIAAFIVERLTKKTIEQYCQENIFQPLGMKTTFHLTPSIKKQMVEMTYRRPDGVVEKWNKQLKIIEQDPELAKVLLGGIGLYSTLGDYLLLLQHLLGIEAGIAKDPILSVGSVSDLFRPTLTKEAAAFVHFPDSNWSVGLCLANNDWPGKRRKGSGFWWGWAGTYYFIDPTTGIALAYGTLVTPPVDTETVKLLEELEEAVYAGLEA